MRKKIIVFNLLIVLFSFSCFSNSIYYYYFNGKTLKYDYKESFSNPKTLKEYTTVIEGLLNKIEKEFNVKINFELLSHTDKSGVTIYGCIADINSSKKIEEIFEGPFHRSILIETVQINIIQPIDSNWNYVFWDTQNNPVWNVKYLILKFNNMFVGNYTFNQTHYYTVETTGSYNGDYLVGEKK